MQMFGGQMSNPHTLTLNFYCELLKSATNLIFVSKNNSKYNHEQHELVNFYYSG